MFDESVTHRLVEDADECGEAGLDGGAPVAIGDPSVHGTIHCAVANRGNDEVAEGGHDPMSSILDALLQRYRTDLFEMGAAVAADAAVQQDPAAGGA